MPALWPFLARNYGSWAGAPGAAVLGELGWAPLRYEVLKSQFNLFGRICSASPTGSHRGLAARVFRYALGQQSSWAREVADSMRDCCIHAPHVWGVSPGCGGSAMAAWRRRCMCPALDRHAAIARHAEVATVPSLRLFAECHPWLNFCPAVHGCPLPLFASGRWPVAVITHSLMDVLPVTGLKLGHASLRSCPLFVPWRRAWTLLSHVSVEQLPDDAFLRLLFSPQHPCKTVGLMSAHMHFVAGVCQAQRSLPEGLNL